MLKQIFPNICTACSEKHTDGSIICDYCQEQIPPIDDKDTCLLCSNKIDTATELCTKCLISPPSWDSACSAFSFTGLGRELLLRYKYSKHLYLIEFLALRLFECWKQTKRNTPDLITFVPMHPLKKFYRGWNQSELIAKEFSKHLPKSELIDLLKRQRLSKAQASKQRSERLKSVKGLFSIKKRDKIQDRTILLIDDILTTGATLNACSKALKKAGAKEVSVLTIARG